MVIASQYIRGAKAPPIVGVIEAAAVAFAVEAAPPPVLGVAVSWEVYGVNPLFDTPVKSGFATQEISAALPAAAKNAFAVKNVSPTIGVSVTQFTVNNLSPTIGTSVIYE